MSTGSSEPEPESNGTPRDSGLSIELVVSIGYKRVRPNTRGDRLEARLDSAGLLLVGSAITLLVLVITLPRILDWLRAVISGG